MLVLWPIRTCPVIVAWVSQGWEDPQLGGYQKHVWPAGQQGPRWCSLVQSQAGPFPLPTSACGALAPAGPTCHPPGSQCLSCSQWSNFEGFSEEENANSSAAVPATAAGLLHIRMALTESKHDWRNSVKKNIYWGLLNEKSGESLSPKLQDTYAWYLWCPGRGERKTPETPFLSPGSSLPWRPAPPQLSGYGTWTWWEKWCS